MEGWNKMILRGFTGGECKKKETGIFKKNIFDALKLFFLAGLNKDTWQFWGIFQKKIHHVDTTCSNYRGTTLFCLRLCGAAGEETLIRKACMQ